MSISSLLQAAVRIAFVSLLWSALPPALAKDSPPSVASLTPPDMECAVYAIDQALTADLLKQRILPPCAESVKKIPFPAVQHGFDEYSWLTFAALNSPQDSNGRFNAPAGTSPDQSTPSAWEGYKLIEDVMLPGGAKPAGGFDTPHVIPAKCTADPRRKASLVVHMSEEAFDQPFKTGPLVDQDSHYSLNVILMNRDMFDQIVNEKLYSRAGQRAFAGSVSFPAGNNDVKPPMLGAYIIKASWKVLPDDFAGDRFHWIWAFLDVPGDAKLDIEEKCDIVKLGLVGFHVGHKTVTRNQWIWTTFEHVDNVPDAREAATPDAIKGRTFNFYDPACGRDKCPVNEVPPQPWDMRAPPVPGFKSQIVRAMPITDDASRINKDAQALLAGSVWAHYQLVSTQWPEDRLCAKEHAAGAQPDPTCAPAPEFLANSTLETYSQHDIGTAGNPPLGVPQATSSCIGCHNNAATHHQPAGESDFTYILEKAQEVRQSGGKP